MLRPVAWAEVLWRGRGFDKGAIRVTLGVSGRSGSHPLRLVSISYEFLPCCHDRGRGFEPRRPRHTFQRTYLEMAESKRTQKGHAFVSSKSHVRAAAPALPAFFIYSPESALRANTNDMTAACAAYLAGVIACVYISKVDLNDECRNNSCITLNSVPTLLRRVK